MRAGAAARDARFSGATDPASGGRGTGSGGLVPDIPPEAVGGGLAGLLGGYGIFRGVQSGALTPSGGVPGTPLPFPIGPAVAPGLEDIGEAVPGEGIIEDVLGGGGGPGDGARVGGRWHSPARSRRHADRRSRRRAGCAPPGKREIVASPVIRRAAAVRIRSASHRL